MNFVELSKVWENACHICPHAFSSNTFLFLLREYGFKRIKDDSLEKIPLILSIFSKVEKIYSGGNPKFSSLTKEEKILIGEMIKEDYQKIINEENDTTYNEYVYHFAFVDDILDHLANGEKEVEVEAIVNEIKSFNMDIVLDKAIKREELNSE